MKIVADKDIYCVEEFFSSHGKLQLLPGQQIKTEHLVDADVLLVRTVTKIDDGLIKDTSLRFIASASSGIDHINAAALKENNIHFSHAPGCNANAVADYFFSTLAWLALNKNRDWQNSSVGIIGAGQVGGNLARKLMAMGMKVLIHDPFLPESHALANAFSPLSDVIAQDIVTLHTPLTRAGNYPTCQLLDAQMLALLKEGAVLVNASRGEVVDNAALMTLLESRKDLSVVLDVWENEPEINSALAGKVAIATPHIAGYSLNGKLNATRAIHAEFCQYFNRPKISVGNKNKKALLNFKYFSDEKELFNRLLQQAYPVENDFLNIDESTDQNECMTQFDAARSNYVFRQEISDYRINQADISANLVRKLGIVGFEID